MTHIYKLSRFLRYMLIISSVGLVVIFLLPVFFGIISGASFDPAFIWAAVIVGGISGYITWGMVTSKIITSPEGIESVYFGKRVKVSWDKVAKVEKSPDGVVNLVFKEAIYKNKLISTLLSPLGYDRNLQLSAHINDLATSELLKDIATYLPKSSAAELILLGRKTKTYQKVGAIGLYYFGWLLLGGPIAIVLIGITLDLEAKGLTNLGLVSYVVITSLLIGLLIGTMSLIIAYNARIDRTADRGIAHLARTHYLMPVVTVILGLVVGFAIWFYLCANSIPFSRDDYRKFALVAGLIGLISLYISGKVEGAIFRGRM